MSGHDFERQVRQKLNDLKMTPSAEAWENIEGSLRERKRRPVAFYWLPLLLIGVATGGYLFLSNDHKTILSDKNSTPAVDMQPKTPGEHAPGNSSVYGNVFSEKKPVALPQKNNENDNGRTVAVTPQEMSISRGGHLPAAPVEIVSTPQDSSDAPQQSGVYGRNLSLMISHYPVGTITPSPLRLNQPHKKPTAKKWNKWLYGISGFIGITAVNEGHLLNFNNAQVEDVSLLPSFAPQPSYKASSISPGLAYSGGLFVKRELSNRFSLSFGANYLQLNTRNKVGNREYGSQVVNAGASGYQFVYSYFTVERDKTSEYHNRYHFIEVPLELHTRLNRTKKMPVQLTTGVAVSRLLKSTSLHFDGTTGVYYKDDRLLNQTQVAAKAGVSIGILNKTSKPLWIGPSAKYNISKILKKDVSAKTNFMSIGIDVKMFIR